MSPAPKTMYSQNIVDLQRLVDTPLSLCDSCKSSNNGCSILNKITNAQQSAWKEHRHTAKGLIWACNKYRAK